MFIPFKQKAIFTLLLLLAAYAADLWTAQLVYIIGFFWAVVLLVERFAMQQVEFEKPRRTKKVKVDDDIPDDPTWEELRATLGRMAQGPTTHTPQHTGPQQLTLFGGAVPVGQSEQIVRPVSNSSVPEEPEWFKQSFR